MKNTYSISYPYMANEGQDDEFEIVATVRFTAMPELPDHWNKSIGTWEPGGGGETEILEVLFTAEIINRPQQEIDAIREAIEAALDADPSPLWEAASDQDAHDADEAADFKRRECRDEPQLYR